MTPRSLPRPQWFVVLLATLSSPALAQAAGPERVEFNRDIRPILADTCFACHGPDSGQRKGDLRLDTPEGTREDRGGYRILAPGKPAESELIRRIMASGPGRMPPRKTNKTLTPRQIELLRQWVEQGAEYQKHWSLIPPRRPDVPAVKGEGWARSPIDHFIRAAQERQGLTPSAEADPRTLARRLSFDLVGLPPSPEVVDAFVKAYPASPAAYDSLVERLLASEHFGERMAVYWLDVVRYADTNGYHGDNHHDIAMYRDYVIEAFNRNKPFDQFTVEQLAGDLLPNATLEQKVASGYNRLNMVTREGGSQAKEYMAKYSADRVRNTATAFLGTTLGCTECHDHKFDPFTTKDFYSFAAFFADIQETAVGVQPPFLAPTPEQQARLGQLEARLKEVTRLLSTPTKELQADQQRWEAEARSGKVKGLPKEVGAILAVPPQKRTKQQEQALRTHYLAAAPRLAGLRKEKASLEADLAQVRGAIPTTLISMSGPPRTMRILPRGSWLDDSGPEVLPAVPATLGGLQTGKGRASRLDLARWMTAKDNPLVARVFVNRLWKLFHGRGLVATLDDFGTQGAWPTHPQLLDWLAVEFVESGWDVKHMVRLMVRSAAYRQTSAAPRELVQRDPYNLWLARQARFRLDAEMVRDNALAVSGLLVHKVGGPSVKPYQPAGYWDHLNFPRRTWVASTGADQYRRGVYTYWCRTFLHPSLQAFDAPTREESCVERPRSNTPLQALVLLNDPSYVEAARALAGRILREGGTSPEERLHFAYRLVLGRQARAVEIQTLDSLQKKHLQEYQKDRAALEALLGVGERPVPGDLDAAELAAWTSVARVLLNLHETITRS